MSRIRSFAPAPYLRRPAALFLAMFVIVAVLAVSLSGIGPAGAADGYEPDATVG